jgi:hypothetical protein
VKTQHKEPAIVALEKKEAEELYLRVMEATNTVPVSVRNGSYQMAVAFKEHAVKARKMCEGVNNRQSVTKMREAWNLISGYYKGTM